MGSLWNRSGVVERYGDDLKADGAQAFFFQGGTVTPFAVFADAGESDALPHPVVADANGRWPDIFVPYTLAYDVQVKNKYGEQISYSQRVPNPNPVDQTVIVPPERQVQTGMMHAEFVNAPKDGYVRLNGKTIGDSTTSGPGSERANDDTLPLFTYVWNNLPDSLAAVSPGPRGVSAAADFAAHKTILPPSMRGVSLAGLDDMGNTPFGAFTGLTFAAGNATTPASVIGINSITLVIENVPAHVHTGSTSNHLGHVHHVSGTTSQNRSPSNTALPGDHHHLYGTATGIPGDGVFVSQGLETGLTGQTLNHTHVETTVIDGAGLFQPLTPGSFGGPHNGSTGTVEGANPTLDHSHRVLIGGTTSGIDVGHVHLVENFATTALPLGGLPGEGAHLHTFTTDSKGGEPGGATRPFNNMPLTRLVTWFIKL